MRWFKGLVVLLLTLYVCSAYPSQYAVVRRLIQSATIILVSSFIVGSTLATQSITQNNLMTPSILGVDRLNVLLSVIASIIPIPWFMKTVIMVIFSALFYMGMLRLFENKLMLMLLVGMCVSTLFGSVSSSIMLMLDPNEFNAVQVSLQASLNGLRLNQLIPSAVVGLCGLFGFLMMHHQHDVMTLGYDAAHNLGIDTKRYQWLSIVSIILMVASINTMVGPLSLLGLLCVNSIREKTTLKRWSSGSFVAILILLCSHVIFEHLLKMNGALGYVVSILGGLSFVVVFLKEEVYARSQSTLKDI